MRISNGCPYIYRRFGDVIPGSILTELKAFGYAHRTFLRSPTICDDVWHYGALLDVEQLCVERLLDVERQCVERLLDVERPLDVERLFGERLLDVVLFVVPPQSDAA